MKLQISNISAVVILALGLPRFSRAESQDALVKGFEAARIEAKRVGDKIKKSKDAAKSGARNAADQKTEAYALLKVMRLKWEGSVEGTYTDKDGKVTKIQEAVYPSCITIRA